MRKEYNFDKMKGRKNPYAKHLYGLGSQEKIIPP